MTTIELSNGDTLSTNMIRIARDSFTDDRPATLAPCDTSVSNAVTTFKNHLYPYSARLYGGIPEQLWHRSLSSNKHLGLERSESGARLVEYYWQYMWLFGEDRREPFVANNLQAVSQVSLRRDETVEGDDAASQISQTPVERDWWTQETIRLEDTHSWKTFGHTRAELTLSDGTTRPGWLGLLASVEPGGPLWSTLS